MKLRAPFPWFGGKSRVAHLVWDRFGDVRNYVEPFAGSLAVLLGRPTEPKIETVNDLDCWIANFWRALQHDPEQLARRADWPVNEADLHARHLWLVNQTDFRERMKTDPDFYHVKIAGWWVWGISQWIGSGWCNIAPRTNEHSSIPGLRADGRGVTRPLPDLSGASGAAGRGIHASGRTVQKRPDMGHNGPWKRSHTREGSGLYDWFYTLSNRLRRVRVCCGDWMRILGPAPTTCIGLTGVFLDPPYGVEERSDVYGEESRDVAHAVCEWAIANGDNPDLRIALCGYEGEHQMPESWTEVAWKANGGFANQAAGKNCPACFGEGPRHPNSGPCARCGGTCWVTRYKREGTRGRQNAHRERIWFSRYCLNPQGNLFVQEALEPETVSSRESEEGA